MSANEKTGTKTMSFWMIEAVGHAKRVFRSTEAAARSDVRDFRSIGWKGVRLHTVDVSGCWAEVQS